MAFEYHGEEYDADLSREAKRDLYAETAPELAAAIERTIESVISIAGVDDIQISCIGEGILENACEALQKGYREDFDAKAFTDAVTLKTPLYNAACSAFAKLREGRAA